jgi:hypothetical protein
MYIPHQKRGCAVNPYLYRRVLMLCAYQPTIKEIDLFPTRFLIMPSDLIWYWFVAQEYQSFYSTPKKHFCQRIDMPDSKPGHDDIDAEMNASFMSPFCQHS